LAINTRDVETFLSALVNGTPFYSKIATITKVPDLKISPPRWIDLNNFIYP
jgi:type IV secretory pathway ATPase VirB11/archaellum biosynthesis ATPase